MSTNKISLLNNQSGKSDFSYFLDKQPLGGTVRTKIMVESSIFKFFYLVSDQNERILRAVRTLSGFDIYACENLGNSDNGNISDGTNSCGSGSEILLCRMRANIFGTKYTLTYFNELEISYETSFLERGKPRVFKIRINELELINKKPLFNTETNSFSLNFSGRVTMPSVKNFQIIPQLDPTYITLTFGKEDGNSYILDFTYPWSILNAFCVGLSSLDHKFGSD